MGVALGLGGAFWLAKFITSFLFGVTAKDPVVFAGVPVLLTRDRVPVGVAAGATRQQGRSDYRAAVRIDS